MNKFLKRIGWFMVVAFFSIASLVTVTAAIAYYTFDFSFDKNKNVLVLGNSRPEHAINDSILPNYFNLAQSGSAYFYDYLKLRELIKYNQQIDTVILGYAYEDIKESMDKWITDENKIDYKLRTYMFLFQPRDYLTLLRANPLQTLRYTPQTILHNVQTRFKGFRYLGGFISAKEHRLNENKKLLKPLTEAETIDYSKYQAKYLLKIYDICNANNIKLILLNIPIHPILQENQRKLRRNYCEFAKKKLPKASLVNHADFDLPDSAYRDLSHLRASGSDSYSKFLLTQNLSESHRDCSIENK